MVFLNRQSQSRMETNRRGFNFLITSRGYHRYSILHKSMRWLPASLYLPLSLSSSSTPSFFFLSFYSTLFSCSWSYLFSHSVSFCSAFHHGGGLEEATAPLVSSPHCCVAIETRRWRCILCFFCFQKQTGSDDGRKEERKQEKKKESMIYALYFQKC